MAWETYWLPNLISWVVGGAISAAVGYIVLRALRTIRTIAQTAAASAGTAADHAGHASVAAGEAKAQAAGAADNSRQANEAIAWLAAELGKANVRGDTLAANTDTLLSELLQQRVKHPEDFDDQPDEDAALTTGRHRFPTRTVPTIDVRNLIQ